MRADGSPRQALALLILSAGALGFEVALVRLYAIQQFYHFAFLVVSLAVLGTAAGGVALSRVSPPPSPAVQAGGFSLAVGLAYGILQLAPFDSYAVAWDRRQVGVLGLYFAGAALPFFFAGWFTGSALARAGSSPGRIYSASLIGSALGPALTFSATLFSRLEAAIALAAAAGLAAAGLTAQRRFARVLAATGVAVLAVVAIRPPAALHLRLSPNKPLAHALLAPEARSVRFQEGPSARLEIIEGSPVHSYPGLSLGYLGPLPPQAGLFLDGDGPYPITAIDPETASARSLANAMPGGIGCRLRPGSRWMVVRPGTGLDVALALACGAHEVVVPVDEPVLLQALPDPAGAGPFPRARWIHASSRRALEIPGPDFDVVEFALTDPFRPVATGAFSLTETYDLTLESFDAALERLGPDGLLIVHRWLTTPAADSLRAWATILQALRDRGLDPAPRLAAFRSLRTSTLLASPSPFDEPQLETIRSFLETNGYDPIYLPDLTSAEVNRFLRIPDDPYPGFFHSLIQASDEFTRRFPYRIDPAEDDSPFFFHFFRWRQTPDALAALGRTWEPFGGSGYLVLLGLLIMMLAFAGVLLIPAALNRPGRGRLSGRALGYFAGIGFGFLLIEISLVQRLTALLDHPAIAFAVVVGLLLLASGIGSRLLADRSPGRILLWLALVAGSLTLLLPPLVRWALPWGTAARLSLAAAVVAPLGFLMGAPFPAGLSRFAGDANRVGLAWAVNGAASGIAGVVAAMAALDLGLSATLGLGALAYLAAWAALQGRLLFRDKPAARVDQGDEANPAEA